MLVSLEKGIYENIIINSQTFGNYTNKVIYSNRGIENCSDAAHSVAKHFFYISSQKYKRVTKKVAHGKKSQQYKNKSYKYVLCQNLEFETILFPYKYGNKLKFPFL